jgi:hypothetical protein
MWIFVLPSSTRPFLLMLTSSYSNSTSRYDVHFFGARDLPNLVLDIRSRLSVHQDQKLDADLDHNNNPLLKIKKTFLFFYFNFDVADPDPALSVTQLLTIIIH